MNFYILISFKIKKIILNQLKHQIKQIVQFLKKCFQLQIIKFLVQKNLNHKTMSSLIYQIFTKRFYYLNLQIHYFLISCNLIRFEESSQDSIIDLGTKISKCVNLKILDLDLQNNSILEKDVLSLFNGICTCNKLEQFRLVIAENRIGLLGTEVLAQNIQKLQNLQQLQLNLQGTNQTKKSIFLLVDNLSRCANLQTFSLMLKNNMIEDGIIQIAKNLSNCQSLKSLELNVSFNSIKGCDLISFGQDISKCSNLAILSLSIQGNKQISLNHIEDSIVNLSKLPQLQDFSINIDGLFGGQNNLCDYSKSVKNLLNCKSLIKLNLSLSYNNISNSQLENLAGQIQLISNLEQLQLKFENNSISDQGFIKLSQAISHLNKLKVLKLNFDRNQIKQNGIISFAESVKFLKDLQSLELSIIYNQQIGESLQILAQNIQNILNLKYFKLDISQCLVEASSLLRFAIIISKCRQLQAISLQFNFPIQNIKARKQIITKLKKSTRLILCN
ncbi:kinase domain protein, putative (macronuclear) [Tetrahymena thermophila SB210]|uniref:Kinase domain protein, putative n=1 Tax=Tetrahymena thermophila (strain SB210) TaxID=312017 RepID=I7M3N8_TETTS|nr:kinase domain protein, putative [Tetrahymena thermophila SB210]EAS03812.2 kinase domain protein, putative [Tetrahymena thermophila SB210]|eukprot:XP_001024057.2 kinase domain protein, putative [Tetrahymena thermophila SB210]